MPRDSAFRMVFETHATSLDNEAGLASGWFDVPLSVTGEEQARALGARRRNDDITAVFCSDLMRSFRTAEIAFGDRSLPIARDERLRECDYGALTRCPTTEIEQKRGGYMSPLHSPMVRAISRSWIESPDGSMKWCKSMMPARSW